MRINTPIFVFFLLSSTVIIRSVAVPPNDLLGVAPEDEKYYKALWSSGTIKCKDGSKIFTKAQLNDEFCDCSDGTDEPGTSACPNGKFYCRNAGHKPLTIFSSRVNDGICDCCDGSDEYDGKTTCKNTCFEAGKVARDKLMETIEIYQEGVEIRKHEVDQAKLSIANDEAELLKLKNEEKILKGIVQRLKDHKERIEKAEEKERTQKEKEEKQKKEAKEKEEKQKKEAGESESKEHEKDKVDVAENEPAKSNDNDKSGILDNSPSNQKKDPSEPAVEVVQIAHAYVDNGKEHAAKKEEKSEAAHGIDYKSVVANKEGDATKVIESLSKEELGHEVGSRWTGKKPEDQNHDGDDVKHNDDTSVHAHDDENNGYEAETDEDHHHYDEDDDSEDHNHDVGEEADDDEEFDISDIESSPSWFEKVERIVRSFVHAFNPFLAPVDISEGESVRKEYDEASGKLSKIRSRISRLSKKLGNDFGPENEFYPLHGRCFESKHNKYVYKVCPFKRATQEEGYSTTRLGEWGKFEDSYNVMLFSNGDNCWNGPDRSIKVRLMCGLKVELSDIDEPSRCEYAAILTTPALCREEKLQELEDELELLDREQPILHDEF